MGGYQGIRNNNLTETTASEEEILEAKEERRTGVSYACKRTTRRARKGKRVFRGVGDGDGI